MNPSSDNDDTVVSSSTSVGDNVDNQEEDNTDDRRFDELQARFHSIQDRVRRFLNIVGEEEEEQEQLQQQQQRQQQGQRRTAAGAANVRQSHVATGNQRQRMPPLVRMRTRRLPRVDCQDEIREFRREFNRDVAHLAHQLRRKYPYSQYIKWCIDGENGFEHCVQVAFPEPRR